MIVAAVVTVAALAAFALLADRWVDRPLPYPNELVPAERCVCVRRRRLSAATGWGATGALAGAAVTAWLAAPWLALVGVAAAGGLMVTSLRLHWQTRWAHRADRCCCPHGVTP